MKKTVLIILAAVLIVPAMAFAAPGFYPGHNNGGFNHPSNGGGVPVHPGHNNGGYNNGGYNNGNNHGHPGHSNGGYNNNNNGHNNGGYNGGYNNGNNHGYPGNNNGYNNGNNHGHPGHGGTMLNAKIREAHRSIKRAFQEAENSYYPFLMSHSDKRRMGMALRRIMMELDNLSSMVGPRFRDNLREVGMKIERARFALTSENDAGRAHRIMERAEALYNNIADIMVR
ncbi:MAG: hypothetical protein AB1403_12610 [Candidatus Riflebacteria bacterium]